MYADSPLRYPGGKGRVSNFIKLLCIRNGLVGGHYAEPYAGGASVALALLFAEVADVIHINDVDPGLMAFWNAVINDTEKFCAAIMATPLDVEEWKKQRALQRSDNCSDFERGFATFYLNRTNRSGIIGNGGVIGGLNQTGKWKIDARFNREELVRRVKRIATYRNRIRLTQLDAVDFLEAIAPEMSDTSLIYLDPPYYVKGQGLYPNFYNPNDHAAVAKVVESLNVPWIVSYDNVDPICDLYSTHQALKYDLRYSAQTRYEGREVMFFRGGIEIPDVENPARIDAVKFRRMVSEIEA